MDFWDSLMSKEFSKIISDINEPTVSVKFFKVDIENFFPMFYQMMQFIDYFLLDIKSQNFDYEQLIFSSAYLILNSNILEKSNNELTKIETVNQILYNNHEIFNELFEEFLQKSIGLTLSTLEKCIKFLNKYANSLFNDSFDDYFTITNLTKTRNTNDDPLFLQKRNPKLLEQYKQLMGY